MIKIILLISTIFTLSCAHNKYQSNSLTKQIKVNDFELELKEFSKSVNGDFVLSLVEYETILAKNDIKTVNELLVLNDSGDVKFNKTIKGQGHSIFVTDFKRYNSEMYSYFVSKLGAFDCNSAIRFLDNDFKELIIYDDINLGLDCHEALLMEPDNILLIYNSFEKFKIPELREIKKDSSIKFFWRLADHYPDYKKHFNSNKDPFHLNSVSLVNKSKLLVNLSEIGEILIINYPSGKIVENISSKTWKFINDKYGGFDKQHNPQILSNGNLILFDNGLVESAKDNRVTRVAEYKLNFTQKTAEQVWEYQPKFPNNRRSGAGSVQVLSNGNLLIGWGFPDVGAPLPENYKYPIFTEIDRAGNTIRTLTSTKNLVSYRVQFVEKQK